MNQASTGKRIRPGFIVLLVCLVAAVFIPFLVSRIRLPPTAPPPPSVPAASPKALARAVPIKRTTPAKRAEDPLPAPVVATPPAARPGTLEGEWGIQVAGIAMTDTAAVELSYSIMSPEKAAMLADGKTPAYIVDQATGTRILLAPPEGSAFRPHSQARSRALMMWQAGGFPPPPSRLVVGKTYAVLLPNPGSVLKKGNKASVVIGDFRTDNITVD